MSTRWYRSDWIYDCGEEEISYDERSGRQEGKGSHY